MDMSLAPTARLVASTTGVPAAPTGSSDIQAKRIHEYKRQLLDAPHVLDLGGSVRFLRGDPCRDRLVGMVSRICVAACLVLLSSWGVRAQEAKHARLHILAIVAPSLTDMRDGIDQGLEEMQRTATLLGRDLHLTWITESAPGAVRLLVEDARCSPVLAVVTAGMPEVLAGDGDPGVSILELSPQPPRAPTKDDDERWIFRVRADRPGTEWNPRLNRFGAGELNERYERRNGRGMTADAWVGWIAIKAIVEAALRSDATDAAALADALRELRFDGHKGEPLYFDENQRLVQPVY